MNSEKTFNSFLEDIDNDIEIFTELAMLCELEAMAIREAHEDEDYMKEDLQEMIDDFKKETLQMLDELEEEGK